MPPMTVIKQVRRATKKSVTAIQIGLGYHFRSETERLDNVITHGHKTELAR